MKKLKWVSLGFALTAAVGVGWLATLLILLATQNSPQEAEVKRLSWGLALCVVALHLIALNLAFRAGKEKSENGSKNVS